MKKILKYVLCIEILYLINIFKYLKKNYYCKMRLNVKFLVRITRVKTLLLDLITWISLPNIISITRCLYHGVQDGRQNNLF